MSISRIRPSLVAVKLEILAGEDVEIDEAEVPYEHVRILGYGYCSFVDEVKDVTSGRNFARKTFRVERGRLDTAQQMLRHEVRTIRELAPHPHIIRVHATYIAGRNLAIILQPVADGGNLAEFLCAYRDMDKRHADKWRHNVSIRRSFGCLARCVDYLHSAVDGQKPIIRHKDIKPGNILIHRGYPILTDFGISTRCSADQTTTTGRPDQFTRKYCAPEVAEFEDRNRKSDIFSLGCVFLEMFAILYSDGTSTPSRLRDLYDAPLPYHERLGGICTTLLDYPRQMDTNALILTIVDMLHKSPSERLSSKQVVRAIEPNVVPCEKCEDFRRSTSESAQPSIRVPSQFQINLYCAAVGLKKVGILVVSNSISLRALKDRIEEKLARHEPTITFGEEQMKLEYIDDDDYVSIKTDEDVKTAFWTAVVQKGRLIRYPTELDMLCRQ